MDFYQKFFEELIFIFVIPRYFKITIMDTVKIDTQSPDKTTVHDQDYLTVKELSKYIKLSESHIYFLVNNKKIPYSKLGGRRILFDKQKIKKWIEEKSVVAQPELNTEKVSGN